MVDDINRVRKALGRIVANKDKKALNFAIEYAKYGIEMIDAGMHKRDIRVQLLYTVCNITGWRGDESVIVRGVLKEAIKAWS